MNKTLLGAIVTIMVASILALFSFLFRTAMEDSANIKLINQRIEQIVNDRAQMKMLWKYMTWEHNQINILRVKEGLEPIAAPDNTWE